MWRERPYSQFISLLIFVILSVTWHKLTDALTTVVIHDEHINDVSRRFRVHKGSSLLTENDIRIFLSYISATETVSILLTEFVIMVSVTWRLSVHCFVLTAQLLMLDWHSLSGVTITVWHSGPLLLSKRRHHLLQRYQRDDELSIYCTILYRILIFCSKLCL